MHYGMPEEADKGTTEKIILTPEGGECR